MLSSRKPAPRQGEALRAETHLVREFLLQRASQTGFIVRAEVEPLVLLLHQLLQILLGYIWLTAVGAAGETTQAIDAGAETIHFHLSASLVEVPSVATIWRILKRNGLITPQPHKRPKSSFIRFEAKLPNETWQVDSTPWQLADGGPVEILNFVDDHSRLAVASNCFLTVKAHDVVQAFHSASKTFGLPASLLSDNGAVFTGRSRRGKVLLELELERLGIVFRHSTPYRTLDLPTLRQRSLNCSVRIV